MQIMTKRGEEILIHLNIIDAEDEGFVDDTFG